MPLWWYRRFPRLTYHVRRLTGASYEREMQLLDALCDRGKTGIDVGAKIGMYTCRIRDRSADVIAFEPNPVFYRYLCTVFAGDRARVEPYALSAASGSAVMRLPYDKRGGHQFGRSTIDPANRLDHKLVARAEELEVQTRALDDYRLTNVGFIKIDVEGHELVVLAGAEKTIADQRPNLLVECNDDHQPDGVAKLAKWLDAYEYDAYFLFGRQLLPMASYERAVHWKTELVENFVCIPRTRPELHDRVRGLAARASRRPRA